MGIAGLLPLLKEIQTPTHVEAYRGKKVGIDAYVWLHRGAYACASDLALGRPTTRYIAYAAHRLRMLKHYGVEPYVVFDGGPLPSKAGTEAERGARRTEYLAKGLALQKQNQGAAARDAFVRCVDVTPAMAYELIQLLIAEGIEYVVAPYEADAQLAYLERHGLIDAVITEDSDLLVFGCKTVLFKLDTYGNCIEIRQERLPALQQLSLEGWGADEFRHMAILSGCDYLPSIVGMGLKNAHRLLRKYESVDAVVRALRLEGKMHVPPAYHDDFRRADFTFVHQRVWDPRGNGCMATLVPLPPDADAALVPWIGAVIPWAEARAIAKGDMCPMSRTPLGRAPAPSQRGQPSIRSFFASPQPAPLATATPRPDKALSGKRPGQAPARRVLGELDPNRSLDTHRTPLTPQASRFFTPTSDPSMKSAGSAEAVASDTVHTPPTSPPSSSPHTWTKHAWADDVSSPVSSPDRLPIRPPQPTAHAMPARAAVARAGPRVVTPLPLAHPPRPATAPGVCMDQQDENDDQRRTAWFKQFSYTGPRAPSVHRTPRRAYSEATPTRGSTAPRLPLASTENGKRTASTPSLPLKRRHTDAHNTPPVGGSAKLLQFRFKDT